jgi:hypothetical protein
VISAVARGAAAFGLLTATTFSQPADCDILDINTPCALTHGDVIEGVISQTGSRHFYWFGVPVPDMRLQVELTNLPADYDLYIFSDQAPDPSVPFLQSANGDVTTELVDAVLSEPGTYLLEVVSDPNRPVDPATPYTLLFQLVLPPAPTPTLEPPAAPTQTPEPARAIVPPILYRGEGAAAAEVRAAGLQPRVTSVDRFSLAGVGTVAAQEPPAGSSVPPGSVVDLFVATGNVEVPPLAGLSEQAAQQTLQAEGFKTDTRRAPSGSVPAGLVIGSEPSTGEVVPSGTTVLVLVSRGE